MMNVTGLVRRATAALVALLLLTCVIVVSSAGPAAAEEALPSGEKILDRYVEATGGKAAYDKIQNRVSKGTLEIPSQGLTLDMTIYSARPGNVHAIIESPAIGKIERGVIDGIAWETSLMTGPQIKEGAEKESMIRDAAFEIMVYWRKLVEKAACVALEDVGGKPAYKVEIAYKTGDPRTVWFDKESGLAVKAETTVESPAGKVPMTTMSSDYRAVDGILLAFEVKVDVMGQGRMMKMSSIEHNIEPPAGIFEFPADVKALLEKKAE